MLLHALPGKQHAVSPQGCLSCHHGVVTTVDFCGNINGVSYVASGGSDYAVVVSHVAGGQLRVLWSQKDAHAGVITRVLFGVGMACGVVYSAARDHVVRLWSLKNGDLVGSLNFHMEKVVDVCQSPDGRFFVSASADDSILVYDVSDAYRVVMRVECDEEPSCLAIVNNMVCCGFCSGGIRFWPLPSLGIHYVSPVCYKQHRVQLQKRNRSPERRCCYRRRRRPIASFPPHVGMNSGPKNE